MTEPTEGRVAVYIDFDNIVISRFEQKHGRGRRQAVSLRDVTAESLRTDPGLAGRLAEAVVDLGAVLDFASSFGAIAISRAYADWSLEVNAGYRDQLMERAVELVQLFPAVRPAKNGADIRLAVDVVEDLFRLPALTHVVIVAGDSDYIALAQRCKRLGRYVVGIGVAGSTSKFLASACDEFADYDALPGVTDLQESEEPEELGTGVTERRTTDAVPTDAVAAKRAAGAARKNAAKSTTGTPAAGTTGAPKGGTTKRPAGTAHDAKGAGATGETIKAAANTADAGSGRTGTVKPAAQRAATDLLRRALRLGEAKGDTEWIPSSVVKSQMLRMDPSFQELALGHKTFTEFVKSRQGMIELKEDGQLRLIRLRPVPEVEK